MTAGVSQRRLRRRLRCMTGAAQVGVVLARLVATDIAAYYQCA